MKINRILVYRQKRRDINLEKNNIYFNGICDNNTKFWNL